MRRPGMLMQDDRPVTAANLYADILIGTAIACGLTALYAWLTAPEYRVARRLWWFRQQARWEQHSRTRRDRQWAREQRRSAR